MPRITVSFKNTPEDLELYNEIMKHSDRSAYVKDRLRGIIVRKEECGKNNSNDDMANQLVQLDGF